VGYQALNENTVLDYMKNLPSLKNACEFEDGPTAREVGDGNLNLVFAITSQSNPKQGILVKQALPYLRVAGESWPLTRERMRFETQALILQYELAPGLVPKVYHHDDEMSLVVMEYLGDHEIMRKSLVKRQRLPRFADHISTFLARTLFCTSDLYLSGPEKKALQAKYINPELCELQENFVFSRPYMEAEENKWNPEIDAQVQAIRKNGPLKLAIAEVKESYMTHAEAIIHSDLHTGSIMVNTDDTRVIDPEFAFCGPMGYDVGALLSNLILNYLSHYAHTPDPRERSEYQLYLLDTVREIWNGFAAKFETLWIENNTGSLPPAKFWDFPEGQAAFAEFRRRYMLRLLRNAVGHAGCKMLRRMMGIVSVWDITSIQDLHQRAVAERLAIKIGSRWVTERHQVNGIEDLIGIVQEETKRM